VMCVSLGLDDLGLLVLGLLSVLMSVWRVGGSVGSGKVRVWGPYCGCVFVYRGDWYVGGVCRRVVVLRLVGFGDGECRMALLRT